MASRKTLTRTPTRTAIWLGGTVVAMVLVLSLHLFLLDRMQPVPAYTLSMLLAIGWVIAVQALGRRWERQDRSRVG